MSNPENYALDRIIEDFLAGMPLPARWIAVVGDYTRPQTQWRVFTDQEQPLTVERLTYSDYADIETDDQKIGYGNRLIWMVCETSQGNYDVRLTLSASRAAEYVNSLFAARLIDLRQNVTLLSALL